MKLHQDTVATYTINGQRIDVDLCWQGKGPKQDDDRFYDLYDKDGTHLNEGEPLHDDGEGVPTVEAITDILNPNGGA
jgi:hypothetical protein|tara:strand:- start:54 stop:284 length:231 start_codon:yes stop_codon:yes gene_type:complete